MYCTPQTLVQLDDQAVGAVSQPCGAWTCERCAPRRQARLRAEVIRGQPDTFATLTCRTDSNKTPDAQAQDLVYAWNLVRKRQDIENLRVPADDPEPSGPRPPDGWLKDHRGQVQRQVRYHPEGFAAFRVLEATKAGIPHMHIAMRVAWIDQAWLSLQMADVLDSPIVEINRIKHVGQIAGYVAKYMGKAPHRFERCKRYTMTQNWMLAAREVQPCFPGLKGMWTREKLDLAEWVAFRSWEGCAIEWLTADKVIARRAP